MKKLIAILSVLWVCAGCQRGDVNYYYLCDGGFEDAGADSGAFDTDTSTDIDTDTGELDAGSDAATDAGIYECIEGDYTITNSLDVLTLFPYTCIEGDLKIQAPGLTSLSLPKLETISGQLHVSGNSNLDGFAIGNLTSVGESLNISYNDAFVDFDLEGLISVSGDVTIVFNSALSDCVSCGFLSQLMSAPASVVVNNNLSDVCTPVPTNCP